MSAPSPVRRTRFGPAGVGALLLLGVVLGVAGRGLFTGSEDPPAAEPPPAPVREERGWTFGRSAAPLREPWPLPRSADERDAFGRSAQPGDPWEVYATHLDRTREVLVTTWRMRLPAVEREGASPVTPEVFAAFVEPRSPGTRPVDQVWIGMRAWAPIWRGHEGAAVRTNARTLALHPGADPWSRHDIVAEGVFWIEDPAPRTVAAWTTPEEFAAAAAEGIVAIEARGLLHEVPEPVSAAFARLARRLPARDPR